MDARLARGERTRVAVLDAAVALATEVGLDGLSLAQLADRLGVSKSGLFAHWRSKEELQLATVERAGTQWTEQIVVPALRAPRGIRRLFAMHEARLAFYAAGTLPGGCFFGSVGWEYDARPGPIRERIAAAWLAWMGLLRDLGTRAVEMGELTGDPELLAFEINAIGVASAYQSRLLDQPLTYALARRAVLDRLRRACPTPSLLPEA